MIKYNFLYLTILFFLLIVYSSCAQQTQLTRILKAEAGVHGLGLGYELPINPIWIAEVNVHAGGGFNISPANEVSFHYAEFPSIHLSTGVKRYYNLHKIRRNPLNNAGNFFGVQLKYVSQGIMQRRGDFDLAPVNPPINDVLISEVHWGVQRSLSDRLFINAKIGAGYMVDFHHLGSTVFPTGGVKLGYRFK